MVFSPKEIKEKYFSEMDLITAIVQNHLEVFSDEEVRYMLNYTRDAQEYFEQVLCDREFAREYGTGLKNDGCLHETD